jgi:hypothetical protein
VRKTIEMIGRLMTNAGKPIDLTSTAIVAAAVAPAKYVSEVQR